MRMTFCTFVTPTRERLTCAVGRRAWTSSDDAPMRVIGSPISTSEDSAPAFVRYPEIGCMVTKGSGREGAPITVIRKARVPAGPGSRDTVEFGGDVDREGRRLRAARRARRRRSPRRGGRAALA